MRKLLRLLKAKTIEIPSKHSVLANARLVHLLEEIQSKRNQGKSFEIIIMEKK